MSFFRSPSLLPYYPAYKHMFLYRYKSTCFMDFFSRPRHACKPQCIFSIELLYAHVLISDISTPPPCAYMRGNKTGLKIILSSFSINFDKNNMQVFSHVKEISLIFNFFGFFSKCISFAISQIFLQMGPCQMKDNVTELISTEPRFSIPATVSQYPVKYLKK